MSEDGGGPQIKVEWSMGHLRMLHNAVSFYLDKRVENLAPQEELKEPTEFVVEMKRNLNRMILEFNYQTQQSDPDCE